VPDARFVFVGDDRPLLGGRSQRAALESKLRRETAAGQVQFTGGVDQPTLLEWYRRANICVVPSLLYESFSYTCAQAMAAGKPVVATHIGGIPETVTDGVSGVLVAAGDTSQLAQAIIRLARDAALRERMGRAGREKAARDFDPSTIARRTTAIYEVAREEYARSACGN
jgi:glycosyltransferase involved in cell wall biosynthesis